MNAGGEERVTVRIPIAMGTGEEFILGFMHPTVKLNNGREVLAAPYRGRLSAVTYANRTQAARKAELLGLGWSVYQPFGSRPFYVAKVP